MRFTNFSACNCAQREHRMLDTVTSFLVNNYMYTNEERRWEEGLVSGWLPVYADNI